MAIEIKYRTYTLKFSEDDETWYCAELDIVSAKSLKTCKAAVDRLSAADRRLDVKALLLEDHPMREPVLTPVLVVLLCEPKSGLGRRNETPKVEQCWVVDEKTGGRGKVYLHYVYPLEAKSDLVAWIAEKKRVAEAVKAVGEMKEAIPTHNPDTLVLAAKEAKVPA